MIGGDFFLFKFNQPEGPLNSPNRHSIRDAPSWELDSRIKFRDWIPGGSLRNRESGGLILGNRIVMNPVLLKKTAVTNYLGNIIYYYINLIVTRYR